MSGPAKLNNPAIATRVPDPSELFFFANPSTGLGGKNTIAVLIALIASNAAAPVKTYADQAAMLANTTIPQGYFALVIDNGGGWALYIFSGADRAEIGDYTLIIAENRDTKNHWVDCGTFDTDAYPAAGGSGYDGAILRGNTFDANDSGTGPDGALGVTIGGEFYPKGTTFRALIDTPGADAANWRVHS